MLNYLLVGCAATAILAGGFGAIQTVRIGNLKDDIKDLKYDLSVEQGKVKALKDLREQERKLNKGSYESLQGQRIADIEEAYRSCKVIQRVINVPKNSDGSRGLIGADSLRELMGQQTGP
jgi:hypothetical protein